MQRPLGAGPRTVSQKGWFPNLPVLGTQALRANILQPDALHNNKAPQKQPPTGEKTTVVTIKPTEAGKTAEEAAAEADKVLAIPVFLMKCVFLWPDSQTRVTRFLAKWVFPALALEMCVGGMLFILEGKYDSAMTAVITFGDVLAIIVILLKLLLLTREGPRLVRIRRQLQYDFLAMEDLAEPEASAANARCAVRCRIISRRFVGLCIPLMTATMGFVVFNAFDPPEERRVTINMPRDLMINPFWYWSVASSSILTFFTFVFYGAGYDTLFLSLILHVSCKCDILKIMLRRSGLRTQPRPRVPTAVHTTKAAAMPIKFEYWKDDGSSLEVGSRNGLKDEILKNLGLCVKYHNMIIGIHGDMEEMFSAVTFCQMANSLLGVGVPGLRLLREPITKLSDVVFLVFYLGWNFAGLLFYCYFSDILAASSEGVADAAYATMRAAEAGDDPGEAKGEEGFRPAVVNLSKEAGVTLVNITVRAQRPLYLTAANFAKVTRQLYLSMMRESHSIYSTLMGLS